MSSIRDRYRRLLGTGTGVERIEFFSDAVFAIAMTLLVIDLRIPEVEPGTFPTAGEVIGDQLINLSAYALSFLIIGLNWMSHHRKFRVIHRWNGTLIRLNLLLLFLVTFVPFPTSLLAGWPAEFWSVALYAFVVGALSMAQLGIWAYAYRAGLMSDEVDGALWRYVALALLPVPLVFWSSIVVAIWNPGLAMYWWFLLIPVSILNGVLQRRQAKPAQSKSSESLRSSDDSRS